MSVVTAVPPAPGGVTGEVSDGGYMPDAWRAYGWQGQPPLICARMQPECADSDPSPARPEAASWGGAGSSDVSEADSHGKVGAVWGVVDGGVDSEVASEGTEGRPGAAVAPPDLVTHGMLLEVIYKLAQVQ